MNPEHPPLVKLVATLPLLGQPLRYPPPSQIPFFKAECFLGGHDFVYANAVSADRILFRARIAAAMLTLLAALVTFAFAYEMFGAASGLIALLLFVFEPNLLAHGSLITTDMGMTFLLITAVYAFYRYVKKPSIVRLVLTGLAAGLALGAKFSAPLIFIILAILGICEVIRNGSESKLEFGGARPRPRLRHALRLAGALFIIGAISLTVLWSLYGFRYAARPHRQTITPPLDAYVSQLHLPRTEKVLTVIAKHHLLPEADLYGLTHVLITPRYMQSYVFGRIYRHGRWFYFPAAFVIKSTLGLLVLLLLLPIAIAMGRGPRWREFLFLTIPSAIYLATAM